MADIPLEAQDVVIVGAGCAGLCAALAARVEGAQTTVLEKAPDIKRTNTSRAGGFVANHSQDKRIVYVNGQLESSWWPEMSAEERVEQAMKLTEGHVLPELIRTWHEKKDSNLDWLTAKGFRWAKVPSIHLSSRQALGAGAGLNKQLLSLALKNKARVLFQHKAVKLLVNNRGEVVGVRVLTPQGFKDFTAGAVVLATSGFQANQEMLMKYFGPEFAYKVRLTGSPYSTGDGHRMAQEVGATLINMDQCHTRTVDKSWVPRSAGMWGPVRQLQAILRYFIHINKLGKRFMDESDPRGDNISCSILKQPGAEIAFVFDEKIKQMKPEEVENYRPPDIIITAPSLEELARKIDVPVGQFLGTVREFNSAVKDGKALSLDVPKRSAAVKMSTPPFYAVYPIWSGLNCTMGGVVVNSLGQVLDLENRLIPGLFAAGEMVAGLFWGRYYTTSGGAIYYDGNYQVTSGWLAQCVVWGQIAGASAARHQPSLDPKDPRFAQSLVEA